MSEVKISQMFSADFEDMSRVAAISDLMAFKLTLTFTKMKLKTLL